MKRDMKLIRDILEYVECSDGTRFLAPPTINGYTPVQVEYRIDLCKEAGLIHAEGVALRSLTWTGHEMLDHLRNTK